MAVRSLHCALVLVLLLAAQQQHGCASAILVPDRQCKSQCGGVDIHYPFGIGDNCSWSADFNISCQVENGIYKPILGGVELLSISLVHGTARVLNCGQTEVLNTACIATYCCNPSSGLMESSAGHLLDGSNSPFRFSDVENKFTVIGCHTLAYIVDFNDTGYQSGCVSTCHDVSDIANGSCTGLGCCQTAIPRDMGFYGATFDNRFNTSGIWNFGRCSYAVLMEAEAFNFTSAYITTTEFNDTFVGQAPVVLDWAIRDGAMSCEVAKQNETAYACLSDNSDCVDSPNGPGYLCNCSTGYQGNPYLLGGCYDIDECIHNPCPSRGVCHNTIGSYRCSCRAGMKFSEQTNTCVPGASLIIGVTLSGAGGILLLVAVIAILAWRRQRISQRRLRKRYFRKNKGILLEQLISSDHNVSDGIKIFSLAELEKATNNFDHTRVVGRGGHGTVYKGILTDQRVVATKRSKLEESTEIDQFINEVAILSHINHRNVVKLYGCCLETEVPLLVYEFISNGTLYDLLHSEENGGTLLPLSWEERLRIAIEVAGALTYLHSEASVSILHRDVKCMNILLNDSYTSKVSDFGASRPIPIDQTHLVTAVQGTLGYLDPEYFRTGQFNEKSDVYSFGVILLELLTRKKPIIENENGDKLNLPNYFFFEMERRPLEEVVDGELLGEASEEAIVSLAQLAEECLSITRGERPTMKDVEMRLQMLRARQGVAPMAWKDNELIHRRRQAVIITKTSSTIPMAADHHGSRQYSLEQEFMPSSRVPR